MKTEFLLTSLERAYEPMYEILDKVNSNSLTTLEQTTLYDKLNNYYNQIHPLLCSYCSELIKDLLEELENKNNTKEDIQKIQKVLSAITLVKLYLYCDYTKMTFMDMCILYKDWKDTKNNLKEKSKYLYNDEKYSKLIYDFEEYFTFYLTELYSFSPTSLEIWSDDKTYYEGLDLIDEENIPPNMKCIIKLHLLWLRKKALKEKEKTKNENKNKSEKESRNSLFRVYNPTTTPNDDKN